MGVRVTGLEVGTVVCRKDDDRVVIQALFLQLCHQPAQVLVQARALTQVVGILFCRIAAQRLQILRQNEVCVLLLGTDRAFVMVAVILVMGFDLGNGHKEGLLTGILIQIFQCEIIDAVSAVALEVDAVVVLIEHIAVITVGSKLQNVSCSPEAGIAAPQFLGNRGPGMYNPRCGD